MRLESEPEAEAWHNGQLIDALIRYPVNIKNIFTVVHIGDAQIDIELRVVADIKDAFDVDIQPMKNGQTAGIDFAV